MIDGVRLLRIVALGTVLTGCPAAYADDTAAPAAVQPPAAAPKPAAIPAKPFTLGYVELDNDPRYADQGAFAGIAFHTFGRPLPGAEVALADAQITGRVTHVDFKMVRASGADATALAATIGTWVKDADVHYVVTDLPGPILLTLAKALKAQPVTLINASAPDDDLRGADCAANVLHTAPSSAMLSDALGEFLASRKWRRIVALQGPAPEDAAAIDALRRSAKKFGAVLADVRPFLLSNDPRSRENTNVPLMTAGLDYDVLYVADASNQFGRYVPYQTSLPRPVVGSAGLTPAAWTWSWDRDGAAQLQHRFEKAAPPRRMNDGAYSAWLAVKAVAQAVLKARSTERTAVDAVLLDRKLTLDTVKGFPGSFRAWDHQLRQPVLLATPNAVIAVAPLPEFLHQSDVLDTLGVDQPESACRF